MDADKLRLEAVGKENRRVLFIVSILTCFIVALVAFVGLGIVLREFFVFDANRTQAQREIDRLQLIAEKQEKDNVALGEVLAEREALFASRQQNVEELIALTSRVAIARHDIQATLDDLNKIRDVLATEQGTLTVVKTENSVLAERRKSLTRDLSTKTQELSDSEMTLETLKKQIAALRIEKESAQAATDVAQKNFAVETERLTNLTIRVEAIRKAHQESERDVEKAKAALSALNLNVQAQEARFAAQTAAAEDVKLQVTKLKENLEALTKDKLAVQVVADALKTAVADASATHTNLLVKIKLNRDTLAQAEIERDNARTERDKAAAQAAVVHETIKAKNIERAELEVDIADLTKRRQTLEKEGAVLARRKQELEAEIAVLVKQKTEVEGETMP